MNDLNPFNEDDAEIPGFAIGDTVMISGPDLGEIGLQLGEGDWGIIRAMHVTDDDVPYARVECQHKGYPCTWSARAKDMIHI